MATTATEIANFALAILGSKRITSIDDDTQKSARYAKLHYDQCRREVLRSHRWNFAMQRDTLSQMASPPEYGWSYQYTLPIDFLRLDTVNEISIWESQVAEFFDIENGRDELGRDIGKVLMSNQSTIRIRYVADLEDTQRFDPLFVTALSTLLASRMARGVTGSDRRESELRQQYESIDMPNARQVDAAETQANENLPIYNAIDRCAVVRSRGAYGETDGTLIIPPNNGAGVGSGAIGIDFDVD